MQCEDVGFNDLLISPSLVKGLNACGYTKLSPVQLEALPSALLGRHVIAQAKAGTGKTLAFVIASITAVGLSGTGLILAPTREIAIQISEVAREISRFSPIKITELIGGTRLARGPVKGLVVGTAGRVLHTIDQGLLDIKDLVILTLDEVDQMIQKPEVRSLVFDSCSSEVQVLAMSATMSRSTHEFLKKNLSNPHTCSFVEQSVTLHHVDQFYQMCPDHSDDSIRFTGKVQTLIRLLSRLEFHQCIVFSNFKSHAEDVMYALEQDGWPCEFTSGNLVQSAREQAMAGLKRFRVRVLLATDLISRGIDASRVTLVVNLDLPKDPFTYSHRIGRTGRFGTHGTAVSLVTEYEIGKLLHFGQKLACTICPLPENYDALLGCEPLTHMEELLKVEMTQPVVKKESHVTGVFPFNQHSFVNAWYFPE